jgi:outer membrane biosynthesis protein TonB
LVGQAGRENFVVYVDEQGGASVTGFTSLLQYGLEETTIEAVKGWKFQPAMKGGKPVGISIPMFVNFKQEEGK